MTKFSLLVLNHNGADLLQSFLPSVLEAARRGSHEVLIVDNASTDSSVQVAERQGAQVMRFTDNRYLFSLNEAARTARHDVLVLLNNDLKVAPDFLDAVPRHFQDPDVFAVAPTVLDPDERTVQYAETSGVFTGGILHPVYHVEQLLDADRLTPRYTLYPPGGAMMCRRDRFLQLGGFDPLFYPIYFEDIDMGYSAWRRGWRVVYEPRSVVVHFHSVTITRLTSPDWVRRVKEKNRFLVVWKNVSDRDILARSLVTWAQRLHDSIRQRDAATRQGLLWAAAILPAILRQRKRTIRQAIIPDQEICPIHVPHHIRSGLGRCLNYPGDLWDALPTFTPYQGAVASAEPEGDLRAS